MDDEITGSTGTHYAYKYRMYDARTGRFFSVDPLTNKYPFYTPYSFSGNRVIDMVELEGLEPMSRRVMSDDEKAALQKAGDDVIEGSSILVKGLIHGISNNHKNYPPAGWLGGLGQWLALPRDIHDGITSTYDMYRGFSKASPAEQVAILEASILTAVGAYYGAKTFTTKIKASLLNNADNVVVGRYSKRPFNLSNAGGKIQNLEWSNANITNDGIVDIKQHISRFERTPENTGMISRLEKIASGNLKATDYDKRFYTHELREYQRYRDLGIKDGVDPGYEVWNDAHSATLEDFKVNEIEHPLYHPSVIED